MSESYPRLAITPGEPAGIGPDVVIMAAQTAFPAQLVVIADPDLLEQRAALLGLPINPVPYNPSVEITPHVPGHLFVLPISLPARVRPGHSDPANASYVLQTLKRACEGCLKGEFAAMVTAPVQKSVINQAGFTFTGHTEYLAEICGGYPVMMLANKSLRVALVTTHLPLSQVSPAITHETLERVLKIIHNDLHERFGISQPRLLVCGLNPHAGEEGHLGREEIEIIRPVLEKLKLVGMHIIGPVPADTAFTPDQLKNADVVVTMYHDQGLPALKAQGFGETVNITLGLPIIRTSVDHGTALSLAGTGQADCSSFVTAVECALDIVHFCHQPISV